MTTDITARAFARLADAEDLDIILFADERTGDDAFEAELTAAALTRGWALVESEDGDLVTEIATIESDESGLYYVDSYDD